MDPSQPAISAETGMSRASAAMLQKKMRDRRLPFWERRSVTTSMSDARQI